MRKNLLHLICLFRFNSFVARQNMLYLTFQYKAEFWIFYQFVRGKICVNLLCHARRNPWFNTSDTRHNLWYFNFSYEAEFMILYCFVGDRIWDICFFVRYRICGFWLFHATQIWCYLTVPSTRQIWCCLTYSYEADWGAVWLFLVRGRFGVVWLFLVQGRFVADLLFRTCLNLCSFYFPMQGIFGAVWLFLVRGRFGAAWLFRTRQNLCCLNFPGKAELRPCLLCHINIVIWILQNKILQWQHKRRWIR
jgi:hypothetical protein